MGLECRRDGEAEAGRQAELRQGCSPDSGKACDVLVGKVTGQLWILGQALALSGLGSGQ